MARFVVGLDSKHALKESVAGGKGASLAWMRRSGFPVPPGYVITPAAFQTVLTKLECNELASGGELDQADLDRIQSQVLHCEIPEGLTKRIHKAYRRLGNGAIAVRSSMIGEDSEAASFAGQLDTVLGAEGEEELLDAIRHCWASAFNSRLFAYMRELKASGDVAVPTSPVMAVVVQWMVHARAAGVAFSADPSTGQRTAIIEATRGLGDALVGGTVTPDRYIVDGRGELSEVREAEEGVPILDNQNAIKLASLVRDVARQAAAPQDVEWAWDGSRFWLLQSRPITSLSGKHVYASRMVSEYVPGLIKPLMFSTTCTAMARNVFGRIFSGLLGPTDVDYDQLVRLIHSRLYADMTLMGELLERLGMPANFLEMMARDENSARGRPRMSFGMLTAAMKLLRFAIRNGFVADEIEAYIENHDRELDRFGATDWSRRRPEELLAHYDKLLALHGETQWYNFVGPMNMMIRSRHLIGIVNSQAPDVVPSDLIRGLSGLKALEPNAEMNVLATRANEMGDDVVRLLIEQDSDTIRDTLSATDEGRSLVADVDRFLGTYGFLSTAGTDFSRTPWIETPKLIWNAIGRAASQPPTVVPEDVIAIREDARSHVRARLNPLMRRYFDRLLASTLHFVDLREQSSLILSKDIYQMRRIFLALGDLLATRSQLRERDDIFYLHYDEVRRVVAGEMNTERIRDLVAARQAQVDADARIELPTTMCGESVPTTTIVPDEEQAYLVGISGSSGVAEGIARIILDPSEAPSTLTRDDILVVPFTDVGWTPLFPGIGGIVAETGGQLSHTSIVAREYGLPAVVSVKHATNLIRTGQPVTVDGDGGRVYLRHLSGDQQADNAGDCAE